MVSDSEPELVTKIETLYEQDFYSLRDECLHNNFLFEDPEFLPRAEFLRERTQQYEDIVWLRPHDVIQINIIQYIDTILRCNTDNEILTIHRYNIMM